VDGHWLLSVLFYLDSFLKVEIDFDNHKAQIQVFSGVIARNNSNGVFKRTIVVSSAAHENLS